MKEKSCGCLPTCSPCKPRCHSATLLRWFGDYDFSDEPDIRTMPGWHHRLADWQPQTTGLIWRIRHFAASMEWILYKSEHCLSNIIDIDRSVDPDIPDAIGPVRDWKIIGVPAAWTGILETDVSRPGAGNMMVAWPWVLEVGCVVCGGAQVMWPGMRTLTRPVPEFPDFIPGVSDPCDQDNWPIYRGGSTEPVCHSLNFNLPTKSRFTELYSESQSLYWTGDSQNPNPSMTCVPEVIIWNTATPGAADPHQIPVARGSSPSGTITGTSTVGGLGASYVRRNRGLTSIPHRVSESTIANVPVIIVTATQPHFGSVEVDGLITSLPDGSEYAALSDWLAIGGKTLVIDFAACNIGTMSGKPLTGVTLAIGYEAVLNSANQFLSGIGSSLSCYSLSSDYRDVFRQAHELANTLYAESAEDGYYHVGTLSIEGTGLHAVSGVGSCGGYAFSEYEPGGFAYVDNDFVSILFPISGGTVSHVARFYRNFYSGILDDTPDVVLLGEWPAVAVEERANGSRIIASGFYFFARNGISLVHDGTGLFKSPCGSGILSRSLALAGLDYEKLKT